MAYDAFTGEYIDQYTGALDDWAGVGPQQDGTVTVPTAAAPVNRPSGQAGNPSAASSESLAFLRDGASTLLGIASKWVDYKRYEATQGGLYRMGTPAYRYQNNKLVPAGNSALILVALAVGAVFLLKD